MIIMHTCVSRKFPIASRKISVVIDDCDLHMFQFKMGISMGTTVVPTKSDSDVVFCLQLLSKTSTCTPHLC